MIAVVMGGSGSGKSEIAENLAVGLKKEHLVYLATMQPFDEESWKRVKRHQEMRQEKQFDTIECFTKLEKVVLSENTTVLLECMSNLVANEMFSPDGAKEKTQQVVKMGIEHLIRETEHLIIVTNNVFEDGIEYEKETQSYLSVLGSLNQWICSISNHVIEVVHGIPIEIKRKGISND
jgi:adenosylcobinamide kinase / adenosylcobinamide-phosphate guanylyltransferase